MISRTTSKFSKALRLTFSTCLLLVCLVSFNKVVLEKIEYYQAPLESVSTRCLKKLANRGGKFVYNEKSISIDQAVSLINTRLNKLNVRMITDGDKAIGCHISDKL